MVHRRLVLGGIDRGGRPNRHSGDDRRLVDVGDRDGDGLGVGAARPSSVTVTVTS